MVYVQHFMSTKQKMRKVKELTFLFCIGVWAILACSLKSLGPSKFFWKFLGDIFVSFFSFLQTGECLLQILRSWTDGHTWLHFEFATGQGFIYRRRFFKLTRQEKFFGRHYTDGGIDMFKSIQNLMLTFLQTKYTSTSSTHPSVMDFFNIIVHDVLWIRCLFGRSFLRMK